MPSPRLPAFNRRRRTHRHVRPPLLSATSGGFHLLRCAIAQAKPDQGTSTAGTISDVNSLSVRALAPVTLKLVVVTTTTTP